MAAEKKALHVEVAEKLIEALKTGTAPWQKPWNSRGLPAFQLPYNAVTGNRYQGINTLSLIMSGRNDPRWMTFKQADDNGWQVSKGSKSTTIQYVKLYEQRTKRDEQGKVVKDEKGNAVKITVKLNRPIITSASVFNAEQVKGIPELVMPDISTLGWQPLERAEKLLKNSGADIQHIAGNKAFYSPFKDSITLPLKQQFDEPGKYYATALHELGHWTGHESRLDRSLLNKFGTKEYAREELRAEIASLLIGDELRIGHDPSQHTAYVDSWISILTDHPFEIHSAAADAEKIYTYLLDLERKRNMELTAFSDDKRVSNHLLTENDHISYNGTVFKVNETLKNGRLKMEDLGSGQQFILRRDDLLYKNLLEAKKLKPEVLTIASLISDQEEIPEPEITNLYQLKR
ncbi:MAG: zincin-like metallopeptidase domain-containing protein [Bacteroidota bacterium]